MKRRSFIKMGLAMGVGLTLPKRVFAQGPLPPGDNLPYLLKHRVTTADRNAAVQRANEMGLKPGVSGQNGLQPAAIDNSKGPHYFGPYANYANSPLPRGPITSVVVVNGGSGYSTNPGDVTAAFSDVYGTGSSAIGEVVVSSGGAITAIKILTPGSGYSVPQVTITDSTAAGTGATALAYIGHLPIDHITIDAGGSSYSSPTITISDPTGWGAVASATVLGGVITDIKLSNFGNNYTAPTVTITDTIGSGASATAVIGAAFGAGLRKFMDGLPGLGPANQNTSNQYIATAVADTQTYADADYYELAAVEYQHKFHRDLPSTWVRGYAQIATSLVPGKGITLTNRDGSTIKDLNGNAVKFVDDPHYMGPILIARRNKPLRIKFTNYLPTGAGGKLFIPVDPTVMGAGMGPNMMESYTQNRTSTHLHGAFIPWISDGTPHQWITPGGETTSYKKGASVQNVPDMWYDPVTHEALLSYQDGATNDPGPGSMTFYYNNQQSARLMFYHDHAWGITRLNVYAGMAGGYLIRDDVEDILINGTLTDPFDVLPNINPSGAKVLPDVGIPLVIQDRTFVDAATIAAQDPNWKWGTGALDPNTGDLWVPSVYMPAQNPYDLSGANAYGRWQYGPWFWPPTTGIKKMPIPNEYYQPDSNKPFYAPWEPPMRPDMPNPSMGMEAFNDTPIVNGVAYPYMDVEPRAYRFRILNAANDRFFNLSLFVADPDTVSPDGRTNTEVKMVPAVATPGFPATWSVDGREGGVPDPATAGPNWYQIGTEGGFLPEPVKIPPQPVNWNGNMTAFNFGNITNHSLLLGCAERADVIVDFSNFAGQTIILYNDAPAAFPAPDPRYDYYTGDPDQTDSGGAPSTLPGYGPSTRTIMQFRVQADGNSTKAVSSIKILNGGSDYTTTPAVVFSGGGSPTQAASAKAFCSLDHITINHPGSGYTYASVNLTDNGSGAAARAVISKDGRITGIEITNRGSGYISAPSVVITGDGTGADATAALLVSAVVLDAGFEGAGYTIAPSISFIGGGGYGAQAIATLTTSGTSYNYNLLKQVWAKDSASGKKGVFESCQDAIIVPQAGYNSAYDQSFPSDISAYVQLHDFTKTFFNGPLMGLNLLNGGTGYVTAPDVTISGGGGSGASATAYLSGAWISAVNVTNRGSGYTSIPDVAINTISGSGSGAAAYVTITRVVNTITVSNGGSGYTTAPTVRIFGGNGGGATATAVVSGGAVTSVIVTNGGSGYTSVPSISFSGGGGRNARATASITGVVNGITVTNNGTGYAATDTVSVSITNGGGTGAAAAAVILPGFVSSLVLDNPGTGYFSAPTVTFTNGGGSGAAAEAVGITLPLEPKAIHDEMGAAYDTTYGRMGGLMGLELPVTNSLNQNLVLYGFSSPPVDLMQNSMEPLGMLKDGTQIWKITHNGVDTHPVHFHLFNVQLINRVAWDGMLLPPEPNELGWKETVRTNPLEHMIVAMRPISPTQPFDVPNSIRLIDPSMPEGMVLEGGPNGFVDPTGMATTMTNHKVNFGWEYVWHCHILSHEEMDMMHALSFGVAPKAPSDITATYNNTRRSVILTWTDNANNETGFKVQRSLSAAGPWTTVTDAIALAIGSGSTVTYEDRQVQRNRTYYYRVTAFNTIGDTAAYAGAAGYPTRTIESTPIGVSIVTTTGGVGTPIMVSSFSNGLTGWAGVIGNVQVNNQAGLGGAGMAAIIGGAPAGIVVQSDSELPAEPAYVIDNSPNNEVRYDASFQFNPNDAVSGDVPVDIFVGLDQNHEPVFGVEYIYEEDQDNPYKIRAWAWLDSEQKYTKTADITKDWHQIEVAWLSNIKGGFSLSVDDQFVGSVMGNDSLHQLDQVLLGPSMNLSASSSGTMYFDEFVSNSINGVVPQYTLFIPWISK